MLHSWIAANSRARYCHILRLITLVEGYFNKKCYLNNEIQKKCLIYVPYLTVLCCLIITASMISSKKSLGQSEKNRKRAPEACDKCRQRKIRCDSSRPRCDQCVRSGFVCHYSKSDLVLLVQDIMMSIRRLEALIGGIIHKLNLKPMLSIHDDSGPEKTLDKRMQHLEGLLEYIMHHIDSRKQAVIPQYSRRDPIALLNTATRIDQSVRLPQMHPRERGNNYKSLEDLRPLRFEITDPNENSGRWVYNHSLLALLCTRSNIRLTAVKIGQPRLAEKMFRLMEVTQKTHEDQKKALLLRGRAAPSELDSKFKFYCFEEFCKLKSGEFHSIVTPEEAAYAFNDTSEVSEIIKSSIVLIIIGYMRLLDIKHRLSKEFIEQQLHSAFMKSTQSLSLAGILPQNSTSFRVLVLHVLVTTWFVPISHNVQALALAHSTGQLLGLDNKENPGNTDVASWIRNHTVWQLLRKLDCHQSLWTSQPLNIRDYGNSDPLKNICLEDNQEIRLHTYQLALCQIYQKCYENVLSRKALERPQSLIFESIQSLDAELDAWRSLLPVGMRVPSEDGYFYLATSTETPAPAPAVISFMLFNLNIYFFALKAHLHALPAFVYSFPVDANTSDIDLKTTQSLNIATDAARQIFCLTKTVRKVLKRPNHPLYHFCLITAHHILFLYYVMFPKNETLEEDITLIQSAMTEGYPTVFDKLFDIKLDCLLLLRRGKDQQKSLPAMNASVPTSTPSDTELPSKFVAWDDICLENLDEFSSETCQII